MNHLITITSEASLDEEEAYNYYEDKRQGLGEEFLAEAEKKYATLSDNPYYFGYVDNKGLLRDVKIDGFPYLIIYEIREMNVVILHLHNTYKLPEKF